MFSSNLVILAEDNNQSSLPESIANKTKNLFINIIQDPIDNLLIPLGEIILIIILTIFAIRIIIGLVDKAFSLSRIESNQANTLRKLINSMVRYTFYFISILTILSVFGINLAPVLAGAGILGIAIGFGAQNLVKDVITGFFLIFERQMEVGDFVEINGKIKGTVEEVGLRITKIREFNQRLHYLSNGMITHVTNYNREKMRAIIPVTVPYETNLDITMNALQEICEQIKKKYEDHLIEPPEIMGITQLDTNGVQFTITAICNPAEYWSLEREMRKEIVFVLQRHGIEISYSRRVIYTPEQAQQLQVQGKEKEMVKV
ncbi:mechanosensitive ion channel family protein [Thermoflavimicrobium dichotomicum]|uniref:Small conductance mechanosensitive channel n=1 Tax=Thermoflavimicrobium dichotomicum TaxID=46223 RepID=A0A1I3T9T1_9BACL|nr:mechanosensitive ion channel family protein [Thermoflavimicrobium dichotomicum]SFJ67715.1 small conductance mechanosensitive channel [Thermoflavimicrobium dichotomicum]